MKAVSKVVDNEICRQAMINRGSLILDRLHENTSLIDLSALREPLISIVIVSFNAPELLAVTITGLAAQARLNRSSFEVIIVDNASHVETISFLQRIVGARIILNSSNVGFGAACNLGADKASGRYLLFLNPDIELLPGALDALVEAHQSTERTGIVGGRLIFPSGELQEAGAHFKNDAQTTYPYLRGAQNPNAPEASYRRETGYISGALMLIEKQLFDRVSGFDPVYGAAYFEDTDLCVRCAKLGYATLYEPGATAVHFESATAKDRADVVARLNKNRAVFRGRHDKWIFANGDADGSDLELRNFSINELRILYIDDEIPHEAGGAGYPRSNAILNHMVSRGYFVSLYPLHRGENIRRNRYRDLSRRIEILGGEGGLPLNEILTLRRGYYDHLWVSRPHNVEIVVDMFTQQRQSMRDFVRSSIIFDAEAMYCVRDALKIYSETEIMLGRDLENAIKHEIRHYALADHVIFVSDDEKTLGETFGLVNTRVLGHALRTQRSTPGFAERSGLAFIGALENEDSPNVDSLLWFKKKIWPLVRARLGEAATMTVVGAISHGVKEKLEMDGVTFTGKVGDLSVYTDAARIFVAPTRYAAGIPHKVHESISRGLPAVVTPVLESQIGWPSGTGYIAADWRDPEAFVDAISRLQQDEALWRDVRRRGFDAMEKYCNAKNFSRSLRDICEWHEFG